MLMVSRKRRQVRPCTTRSVRGRKCKMCSNISGMAKTVGMSPGAGVMAVAGTISMEFISSMGFISSIDDGVLMKPGIIETGSFDVCWWNRERW